MIKTIAIVSIFGSIASIISIITSIVNTGAFTQYEIIGFIICVLLSLYVLLVPNNKFEKNVASKFRIFDLNLPARLIDQTGRFKISGLNPVTIVFDIPFIEIPKVELFNVNGYNKGDHPIIAEITIYQVILIRKIIAPHEQQEYGWVARGNAVTPTGASM